MPQGGTVTPLEALKALMDLIGDNDLPDNGELNGAAICDMARAAIASATKTGKTKTIVLTLSDPISDLECEECGKEHKYDPYRSTWDCITLLDESTLGATSILGAWCNEKCLLESVNFRWR